MRGQGPPEDGEPPLWRSKLHFGGKAFHFGGKGAFEMEFEPHLLKSLCSSGTAEPMLGTREALQPVLLDDCIHIALASHDDGARFVDARGHDVQYPLDLAPENATRSCAPRGLHDHGHGETLIHDAQLAVRLLGGALLVRGVEIHAAVQDGAVHVRDHGADVAGAVGLRALLPLPNYRLHGGIPVLAVALVAAVDSLTAVLWELHVRRGVHELPERGVQREAVHPVALERYH
mmetsp:Transcript_17479/g.46642  ORF Transcript_17479/g.46642 Transcript_17479/m.46642 type:complete len:232 (-) Transcript_17479:770-1465(-)